MRTIDCVQGSDDWHEARRGMITGTKLEQAFKGSDALLNELIAERMATFREPEVSTKEMDKGKALEPFAKKAYEQKTGFEILDYGIILNPHRDDIGISPDGVSRCGTKAIEIKSPNSKTHIEYMRSDKPPKKYFFQFLAYFLNIHDLKELDFVSYDEKNEVKPLVIKTFTLPDLLDFEYIRGKKVNSIDDMQEKVFAFADKVNKEYEDLIF